MVLRLIQPVILISSIISRFNLDVSFFYLGNVYIADMMHRLIRKETISTGIINTIAGTGTNGYSGDNGPATAATINDPDGVTLDSSGFNTCAYVILFIIFCLIHLLLLGNVYIVDTGNHVIRKITASTGIITTVAGKGIFTGDGGVATSASLYFPGGVALDSSGTPITDIRS